MKCERMPGLRSRRTIQSLAQENACAEKPHFDILRGDIQNLKWSKSIPGFKKTQGVAYIPSPNKVFVASGDDGMLRVFRGDSLELLDSIKLEPGPNRVNYDPHKSILYVGYGGKDAGKDYGEVGIIDAETDKRLDLKSTRTLGASAGQVRKNFVRLHFWVKQSASCRYPKTRGGFHVVRQNSGRL
jgi:DNA-binding beta-propeller fold protein YncE